MKTLFIHSDFIEYEARKKTKLAEDVPPEKRKNRVEEVLVVFISFEKRDEGKEQDSAKALVANVVEIAGKVETKRIVLYPYAHLSSSLGKPSSGIEILHSAEKMLAESGYEVHASPFGWYKSFNISCKGHPLSELSREIVAGEEQAKSADVSEAVKAEEKLKSTWFVLDTDGKEHPLVLEDNAVKGFAFNDNVNLKKFCQYEMAKSRTSKEEPPHIELMRRLELVDYEPGSDPGNFRYYPK
ncbi:MAG: threonine--tRNA ligase, partial [Candidatus Thermoplasmatota archaeon]|nr:threonine--tRNA ligase [Candidatus Thermoplasmatota archaeon]